MDKILSCVAKRDTCEFFLRGANLICSDASTACRSSKYNSPDVLEICWRDIFHETCGSNDSTSVNIKRVKADIIYPSIFIGMPILVAFL